MSMILYSLNSIFRKESESKIRIDMRALVLNLLKIESCLNALDFILIDLVFLQGIRICDQNRHASPGAQPAKNSNLGHIVPEKVQKTLDVSRINTALSESESGA
jgi:hypothetical protein